MPPRKTAASIGQLYADIQPQSLNGIESQITLANLLGNADLAASLRRDLAGGPISIMRPPYSYQDKVVRMWESYQTDPLFRKLINRMVDFIANGSSWEIYEDVSVEKSWTDRVKSWFTSRNDASSLEETWNAWSDQINLNAPNTPQGLNQVVQWAARHCLLSGMFIPHWKWGSFQFGRKVYLMPTELTCYPASLITLKRNKQQFMSEEILLMMSGLNTQMSENVAVAPQTGMVGANLMLLENMGTRKDVRDGLTEAFALKYEWSPGDLSTTRTGSNFSTGWGQYPSPPFMSLLPQFVLRQKLFAADIALSDAVANYQKVFKIGDKDNPPKARRVSTTGAILEKGTIAEVQEILQANLANPALALYLPYFVDYDIKLPDVGTLLNEEKYVASHIEMLQAFGIFASRSQAGRNERFELLNTAGFEEQLESVRSLIRSFLHKLAMRIMQVNPSLRSAPVWTPTPLNTKSKDFKDGLLELAKMGRISSKTLHKYFGLNTMVEQRRIAEDLARRSDDLYDDNVPVTFVQQTTQGGTTPDVNEEKAAPQEPSNLERPNQNKTSRTRKNRRTTRVSQTENN